MTMENSPRATSVPPARQRPAPRMPARCAAYQPVATFVSAVTTARSSAVTSTGGMSAGSVDSPKNTLMRDDRPPTRTNLDDQLAAAFEMTKHTYLVEAQDDPRVQMVAHAVS